jgi:ribonuclease HI
LENEVIEKEVKSLLEKGLIQPSISPFGAPILFLPKPDGTLRCVLDYRELNAVTIKNRHPIPRIDDIIDQFRGAYVFSNLDLVSAYNQFQLQPEDQQASAFSTPQGHFEWKVLSLGLTNAPGVFSRAMYDILSPLMNGPNRCIVVYLDDIAILSKTPEEHVKHVEMTLKLLHDAKLLVKLRKCHFFQPEIKFLGHILSAQGVQADPQKLKAVQEWQYPKNRKELLQFLGLCNYFRKRVPQFSRIASPLNHLTKGTVPWSFDSVSQNAFSQLKQALSNPPVLAYPDPDLPYELISDASLTGCGAVLTQNGNPIAYFSSKFCPAEQNYTTTEQEMLGVVKALKEWRCYLEGCKSLTVITDHNPLTYFPKNVRLSGRQARWAEFLSRFQMTWKHTPGVDNPADGLSRLHGTLVKSASIVVLAALSPSLMDHVVAAYSADSRFTDEQFLNRYNLKIQKNVWYTASDKIVIPQSVISKVISASHDDKFAGHFGVSKTLELLQRHFWWPAMRSDVEQYVASCLKCQVNKSSNLSPAGLLQPLPIPDHRWDTVSLDFITGLPKSALHYDAILVCVDKLSKFVQLIPCSTTITAEHTAKIFTDHIIAHHGVPKHLISDRDPRFTSPYWKRFCYDLGIKQLMSTAYHPETDGQTERTNRVVEEVLRNFLSDRKLSDWSRMLAYVQFSINNAQHASTGYSPFYLNYGRHPRSPLNIDIAAYKSAHHVPYDVPSIQTVHEQMQWTLHRVKRLLQGAQDRQKFYADARRRPHTFAAGNYVLLNTKNLRLHGKGVRKLFPKFIGPFLISDMIGENAARLKLPSDWSIHPVFHVSLLKLYHGPVESFMDIPEQALSLDVDNSPVYSVEKIISSRMKGRSKTEFLVKWHNFSDVHNSWITAASIPAAKMQEFLQSSKPSRS